MATIIDNIELDETNEEFFWASELVKYGHPLIYLTGKAGTGKTTFLKYLRQTTEKNTIVLAFTGVAAINAGGQTINSFFKVPFGPFVPNDKRLRTRPEEGDTDKSTIYNHFQFNKEKLEIIRGLELLIIDEISMVRCDLLDVIDRLLRVFRKRENEAFGGVQVILIGDTFQLPPIDKEWHILQPFYESTFFFSSKVILSNKPVYIELKKIYRQNEQEFIELLNRVRINKVNQNELNLLNSKFNPTFSPTENSNYITLATHNDIVKNTNLSKLAMLPGEIQHFEATITNDFPDNIMPTDRVLQLKEGAQIMFIKNDKPKRIYNGTIAKIIKIENQKITVEYEDKDTKEITKLIVEKQIWNNIRYSWNEKEKKIEEEIIGIFTQYPIKLAWAITVHKSQGLTFEKVIADLGGAFASGQVYVALSRCTSFNGLILKTRINHNAIQTDPQVIKFAENETPSTLIVQELNSGKADFYYKKVREEFKSLNFTEAYANFIKAIKFRNDIETESFKKYFIVTASKLGSFKQKLTTTLEGLEITNHEKLILENAIEDLETEKNSQQAKMNEQNKAIKLLLDKTKELEKLNEKQKSEMSTLTIEKQNAEKSILQLKKTDQGNKKVISELKATRKQSEQEIERLRNLKWHQKLFGQK
ncbi:AAA family ATPase [Algoriphagus sp. D3-2-R+10]|uniref:ATP-dependent DNA helicase n=1 Tax=Algoriphagus aurantiacus TaxID=3103948 RepID=UPI002B3F4011|nr:AAA family ATPase [Algoriphagus sp. D3-2-R+10]MEB2774429.1 AAA family ATPase [Algoriphagus sp. D3-2-R+10]